MTTTTTPEIIQYIRYQRGDRQHLIGALVAFKRERNSSKWYIGWSLKHKDDWAVYSGNSYQNVEAKPFDKKIALNAARERAIKWAIEPCSALPIPQSILKEFILFVSRGHRYFKNDDCPSWIWNQLDPKEFKSTVKLLLNEIDQQKQNRIDYLINQIHLYSNGLNEMAKEVEKLSKKRELSILLIN